MPLVLALLGKVFGSPASWVGLLLACVLGIAGIEHLRLAHAKSDLAAARAQNLAYAQQISDQNAALAGWRLDAEKATTAAQSAVRTAVGHRPAVMGRVAQIAAVAPPAPGVCRDAAIVSLVHGAIR